MPRHATVVCLLGAVTLIYGCGGDVASISPLPEPPAPGPGAGAAEYEVGPLVVRTASAAGFVAEDIPTDGEVSLVALYGSTINYLASTALLDRIVFSYGGASPDIWVCNLDGSNRVKLTDNAAEEMAPCWSPDGTRIAFERTWSGQDSEIMIMDADGSGVYAVTSNALNEHHPTFGPAGRRIAFDRDLGGNREVYSTFLDGSGADNLSAHPSDDYDPDWSPTLDDPTILFVSERTLPSDIYEMNADGSNQVQRTTTPDGEFSPSFHPRHNRMAYDNAADVFVTNIGSGTPYDFSASRGGQMRPCWSSDGRFICYESTAGGGDHELVLQETESPWAKFGLTHNSFNDICPDLGSPTMQTDRVLIGPPGSDWGGNDPVWASAYAGIVAIDYDGYRSFVRIGIHAADVETLAISPLSPAVTCGLGLAGVVVEAAAIVNLREDGGRERVPTLWDFSAQTVTAAILYFNVRTGKLILVLPLRDSTYPSAAGAPAGVTQSADGDSLVVTGSFAAVFDSSGTRVAGASSRVTIGADGAVNAN